MIDGRNSSNLADGIGAFAKKGQDRESLVEILNKTFTSCTMEIGAVKA